MLKAQKKASVYEDNRQAPNISQIPRHFLCLTLKRPVMIKEEDESRKNWNLVRQTIKTKCIHWPREIRQMDILFQKSATNDEAKAVGFDIARYSSDLRQLRLLFYSFSEITDNGTEVMSTKVSRHLPNLKALHFYCPEKTSDKGLKILGSEIARYLTQLQHLCIQFTFCTKITDEAVILFILIIVKNLSSLQELNLDFSSCHSLTSNVVHSFDWRIIQYFKKISKLNLWFDCFSSDQSLAGHLKELFAFIPRLSFQKIRSRLFSS